MKNLTCRWLPVALVFCMLLVGCTSRSAVTENSFTVATESLGYTAQEIDETTLEQYHAMGISQLFLYSSSTGGGAALYFFENDLTAQQHYAQAVSELSGQGSKIKQIDSSTYHFAHYEVSGTAAYVVRTNATLLYVTDTPEAAKALMEELGY